MTAHARRVAVVNGIPISTQAHARPVAVAGPGPLMIVLAAHALSIAAAGAVAVAGAGTLAMAILIAELGPRGTATRGWSEFAHGGRIAANREYGVRQSRRLFLIIFG